MLTPAGGPAARQVEPKDQVEQALEEPGALGRAVRRGVGWSALQTWSIRATTAVSFILISRQLSPAEFGVVALGMSVIALLSLLNERGLATYIVRAEDVDQRAKSTALWTALGLAVVLTAGAWSLAAPAACLLETPQLIDVVRWLSLGFLLGGAGSVPDALLRRRFAFRQLALRGLTTTLVGSCVGVALALTGAGVWALVAQYLVRSALGAVLVWTLARWKPSAVFDRSMLRLMYRFASKLFVIELLHQVQDRSSDFILGSLGSSATLGAWSVSGRLVSIVQETGTSVVNAVAVPAFSRLQTDRARLFSAYTRAVSASGMLLFPAFMLLALVSPLLVPQLMGPQWASSGEVARILALTAAIGVFSFFDRNVFIALDRLRPEVWIVTGTVALQLLALLLFVRHGLVAVALAVLVRAVVVVPARFLLLHRYTGAPLTCLNGPLRIFSASVGATCAAVAACWSVSTLWAELLVASSTMLVTYPALLWVVARGPLLEMISQVRRGRR